MHLGRNQYNLKGLKNEKTLRPITLFQEKMLKTGSDMLAIYC